MRLAALTCEVLARSVYLCAARSPHVVDVRLNRRGLHDALPGRPRALPGGVRREPGDLLVRPGLPGAHGRGECGHAFSLCLAAAGADVVALSRNPDGAEPTPAR